MRNSDCGNRSHTVSMRGFQRGDRVSGPRSPEIHKTNGFISNTDPYPLKVHKANKPTFNVGPSSTRQRSVNIMTFRWLADDSANSGIWIIPSL